MATCLFEQLSPAGVARARWPPRAHEDLGALGQLAASDHRLPPKIATGLERLASLILANAEAFQQRAVAFAPYVDYSAPTLTFRGADPSDPSGSQINTRVPAGALAFRGTEVLLA